MEIRQVMQVTDELVHALARLVLQLNPSAPTPTRTHLDALVSRDTSVLFVAEDRAVQPSIVGTLTLAWYPIPSGVRVWIEDVVVDQGARGRGIGEALVRTALAHARSLGASSVDLMSRPAREAANRLYRRIGFQHRETNA